MTKPKVVFLLGSGISIPAGMPSTSCITKQVLSGEGVIRHTDGTYYISSHQAQTDFSPEWLPRILSLLRLLEGIIKKSDQFYQGRPLRQTNYEDIYYVVNQVHDYMTGNYDNPVVQPLIEMLLPHIENIWSVPNATPKCRLKTLALEAERYIRCVVWRLLTKEPTSVDHLTTLKDACLDDRLACVDLATLNHDILLEQFLQNDVKVSDGFDKPVNKVRWWNPYLLERSRTHVRLLKLHGSVNWFRFPPSGNIGIPLDGDYWHAVDSHGKMQDPEEGVPLILVGTFNKLYEYNSSIFADLQYHFRHSLRESNRLVICGYGFCDKGINTHIVEWLGSSTDHKVIIVHHEPERLKRSARYAVFKNWDSWHTNKQLETIKRKIQDTCWKELSDLIFS